MNKVCHYYLTADTFIPNRYHNYRAIFSNDCEIKRCFIVASSLKQALSVLYDNLSPVWTSNYLDTHLDRVEFFDFH